MIVMTWQRPRYIRIDKYRYRFKKPAPEELLGPRYGWQSVPTARCRIHWRLDGSHEAMAHWSQIVHKRTHSRKLSIRCSIPALSNISISRLRAKDWSFLVWKNSDYIKLSVASLHPGRPHRRRHHLLLCKTELTTRVMSASTGVKRSQQ